jgi:hypothetical protein
VSAGDFGPVSYGGSKPLTEFGVGDVVLGAAPDGWVFLRVLDVEHTYHPKTRAITWTRLLTQLDSVEGPPLVESMFGIEHAA